MNNKSKNIMMLSMSICYLIISNLVFKLIFKDSILIYWFNLLLFYPLLKLYYKIFFTSICLIFITNKFTQYIILTTSSSMKILEYIDPFSYHYYGELVNVITLLTLSIFIYYLFSPLIIYLILRRIGFYKRINIIAGINNE